MAPAEFPIVHEGDTGSNVQEMTAVLARDLPVMGQVEGRASIWHTGRGPTALPGELFGPWLQASAS